MMRIVHKIMHKCATFHIKFSTDITTGFIFQGLLSVIASHNKTIEGDYGVNAPGPMAT